MITARRTQNSKKEDHKRELVGRNDQIIVVVQIYRMVDGGYIEFSNSKTHFHWKVNESNDSNVT